MDEAYYSILSELQATDFTLVELALYLHTHPQDKHTLEQFNEFSEHKKRLKSFFEEKFGPLQQFGNSPINAGTSWSDAPWPWQV